MSGFVQTVKIKTWVSEFEISIDDDLNARFLLSNAEEMFKVLQSVNCGCNALYSCAPNCFMPKVEELIEKIKGK